MTLCDLWLDVVLCVCIFVVKRPSRAIACCGFVTGDVEASSTPAVNTGQQVSLAGAGFHPHLSLVDAFGCIALYASFVTRCVTLVCLLVLCISPHHPPPTLSHLAVCSTCTSPDTLCDIGVSSRVMYLTPPSSPYIVSPGGLFNLYLTRHVVWHWCVFSCYVSHPTILPLHCLTWRFVQLVPHQTRCVTLVCLLVLCISPHHPPPTLSHLAVCSTCTSPDTLCDIGVSSRVMYLTPPSSALIVSPGGLFNLYLTRHVVWHWCVFSCYVSHPTILPLHCLTWRFVQLVPHQTRCVTLVCLLVLCISPHHPPPTLSHLAVCSTCTSPDTLCDIGVSSRVMYLTPPSSPFIVSPGGLFNLYLTRHVVWHWCLLMLCISPHHPPPSLCHLAVCSTCTSPDTLCDIGVFSCYVSHPTILPLHCLTWRFVQLVPHQTRCVTLVSSHVMYLTPPSSPFIVSPGGLFNLYLTRHVVWHWCLLMLCISPHHPPPSLSHLAVCSTCTSPDTLCDIGVFSCYVSHPTILRLHCLTWRFVQLVPHQTRCVTLVCLLVLCISPLHPPPPTLSHLAVCSTCTSPDTLCDIGVFSCYVSHPTILPLHCLTWRFVQLVPHQTYCVTLVSSHVMYLTPPSSPFIVSPGGLFNLYLTRHVVWHWCLLMLCISPHHPPPSLSHLAVCSTCTSPDTLCDIGVFSCYVSHPTILRLHCLTWRFVQLVPHQTRCVTLVCLLVLCISPLHCLTWRFVQLVPHQTRYVTLVCLLVLCISPHHPPPTLSHLAVCSTCTSPDTLCDIGVFSCYVSHPTILRLHCLTWRFVQLVPHQTRCVTLVCLLVLCISPHHPPPTLSHLAVCSTCTSPDTLCDIGVFSCYVSHPTILRLHCLTWRFVQLVPHQTRCVTLVCLLVLCISPLHPPPTLSHLAVCSTCTSPHTLCDIGVSSRVMYLTPPSSPYIVSPGGLFNLYLTRHVVWHWCLLMLCISPTILRLNCLTLQFVQLVPHQTRCVTLVCLLMLCISPHHPPPTLSHLAVCSTCTSPDTLCDIGVSSRVMYLTPPSSPYIVSPGGLFNLYLTRHVMWHWCVFSCYVSHPTILPLHCLTWRFVQLVPHQTRVWHWCVFSCYVSHPTILPLHCLTWRFVQLVPHQTRVTLVCLLVLCISPHHPPPTLFHLAVCSTCTSPDTLCDIGVSSRVMYLTPPSSAFIVSPGGLFNLYLTRHVVWHWCVFSCYVSHPSILPLHCLTWRFVQLVPHQTRCVTLVCLLVLCISPHHPPPTLSHLAVCSTCTSPDTLCDIGVSSHVMYLTPPSSPYIVSPGGLFNLYLTRHVVWHWCVFSCYVSHPTILPLHCLTWRFVQLVPHQTRCVTLVCLLVLCISPHHPPPTLSHLAVCSTCTSPDTLCDIGVSSRVMYLTPPSSPYIVLPGGLFNLYLTRHVVWHWCVFSCYVSHPTILRLHCLTWRFVQLVPHQTNCVTLVCLLVLCISPHHPPTTLSHLAVCSTCTSPDTLCDIGVSSRVMYLTPPSSAFIVSPGGLFNLYLTRHVVSKHCLTGCVHFRPYRLFSDIGCCSSTICCAVYSWLYCAWCCI